MLARELLRTSPDRIRAALAARGSDAPLAELLATDARWREAQAELEALKAERNRGSKEVGALFAKGRKEEGEVLRTRMAELGTRIAAAETEAAVLAEAAAGLELAIPNLPHETVPVGPDETANRVEHSWGAPPAFDFEPRAHWDLGPALGILDFERAAKVAGARFAVLWGMGAALERALVTFMLDLHRGTGYREVYVPFLVNREALIGTGQLPKFGADLFRVEGTDLYLVPTAEVPVTNLHRGEVLEEARGAHQGRGVGVAAAGDSLPGGHALDRRHWVRRRQDSRPRGVAAGTTVLPGDLLLLQLRGLPGPARGHQVPACGWRQGAFAPHSQRLGPRGGAHPHRDPGELPARRRDRDGARGFAAVPGRAGAARPGAVRKEVP